MCVHITPSLSLKNNERKNAITHKRAFAHVHTYTHTCTRPHSFSHISHTLSITHTQNLPHIYAHKFPITHTLWQRERKSARTRGSKARMAHLFNTSAVQRSGPQRMCYAYLSPSRASTEWHKPCDFLSGPDRKPPKISNEKKIDVSNVDAWDVAKHNVRLSTLSCMPCVCLCLFCDAQCASFYVSFMHAVRLPLSVSFVKRNVRLSMSLSGMSVYVFFM